MEWFRRKFKDGESPEECVIREVKEESGLKLIKPSLKGIITFPAFDDIDDWMVLYLPLISLQVL